MIRKSKIVIFLSPARRISHFGRDHFGPTVSIAPVIAELPRVELHKISRILTFFRHLAYMSSYIAFWGSLKKWRKKIIIFFLKARKKKYAHKIAHLSKNKKVTFLISAAKSSHIGWTHFDPMAILAPVNAEFPRVWLRENSQNSRIWNIWLILIKKAIFRGSAKKAEIIKNGVHFFEFLLFSLKRVFFFTENGWKKYWFQTRQKTQKIVILWQGVARLWRGHDENFRKSPKIDGF